MQMFLTQEKVFLVVLICEKKREKEQIKELIST